jgi:ABC-type uncharacterized transport system ATPase subunit
MIAVEMTGITKRFGNVIANNKVDFDLQQGEVHALLGENGAGKTTLMRILYGLYRADEGEITVNGQIVHITSPKDAIAAGIGMVSQHFTLVPTLTVAENIVLGYQNGFRLSPREIEKSVEEASTRFGVDVKADALVRHLSVGEKQRVEILKALYRKVNVLIMDEPTAVLVPHEVDILFQTLRRLQKEGLSVIFITHKMNEVMTISDRITVLRDGFRVGTVARHSIDEKGLAQMMVGRFESFAEVRQSEHCTGSSILKVENLAVNDNKGLPALKGITLEVCQGEILGLAGVSGNGQSELTQILAGTLKPASGKITIENQDITNAQPSEIAAAGVGRIPEDRHAGLVGELSVAENMALENLHDFVKNGVLNKNAIVENAQKLIAEYQIKATPNARARTLSGGNMQKVILAIALSHNPRVIIAAQPTRGLDIGATDYVRNKLAEQRQRGAGVLLISEDLEEILALSDRIAVIYEGNIVGIVQTEDVTEQKLGLMMTGAREVKVHG